MKELLERKTILIAGAGGLLGCHFISGALEQGANVIAADINLEATEQRLKSLGVDIINSNIKFMELDVTCQQSVQSMFSEVGKIDGVVNTTYPRNSNYGAHIFDVNVTDFNENVALLLGSTFLFSQQCALYFKKNLEPFSLVNISSVYGVIAPKFKIYKDTMMTTPIEYAASKAAIQHLTKYLVSYVADSRFKVNCVSPGGIFDNQPKAFLEAYKAETSGKGMLKPEDVTGAVLFLLSDQSRYITGQNIIVDDGFSL